MNPDRLKFAQARGARIQDNRIGQNDWRAIYIVNLEARAGYELRIHPDDAYLQYGLFSQMCINIAMDAAGELYETPLHQAVDAYIHTNWYTEREVKLLTPDEWAVAYLFFAEYLADQGL